MKSLFTVVVLFVFIISCEENDMNSNKALLNKKNDLPQQVSTHLKGLGLKNVVVMNEENNNLNIFIQYLKWDSLKNQDDLESFFLDYKSDTIINELICYEFKDSFKDEYDTIKFFTKHEGYSDDLMVTMFSKKDLGKNIESVNYNLNKLMIRIGYDNMILFDLASIKTGDNMKGIGIFDLNEKISKNKSKGFIDSRTVFNFLQTIRIVLKSYPELKNIGLQMYDIAALESDSLILDNDNIEDFVRDNYDSTFVRPW